jgi:predicted nucleotidyltransferase
VQGLSQVLRPAGPPTGYPDANALLQALLAGVQDILGEELVGVYLFGSLALGSFDPRTSDVDVLVVTAGELAEAPLARLQAFHARLYASDLPLATEVEAAYIPVSAVRRWYPNDNWHPHIDRGEAHLLVKQHDTDWVVQRYVVREHGVTLYGPHPKTLIDPVSSKKLKEAVRVWMHQWWAPMVEDPLPLRQPGYRAYAVLTMCRLAWTLHEGTVLSKPAAARWALQELDGRWGPLIRRALDYPDDDQEGTLADTRALIREICEENV